MLWTLLVSRAFAQDQHGLRLAGTVFLAIVVGTVVWNLIP
jgi:hypothetical protein